MNCFKCGSEEFKVPLTAYYHSSHSNLCSLSCWLQDDVTFYVSVVGYAALVFLFNIAVNHFSILIQFHGLNDLKTKPCTI